MGWPGRMTHLEWAITKIAITAFAAAVTVGLAAGITIDRILHRGDQ